MTTRSLFTQYGCGCPSADVCTDPKTWGKVDEPVEVLGRDDDPRCDPDVPVYRIRFRDGTEADAFGDELTPEPVR